MNSRPGPDGIKRIPKICVWVSASRSISKWRQFSGRRQENQLCIWSELAVFTSVNYRLVYIVNTLYSHPTTCTGCERFESTSGAMLFCIIHKTKFIASIVSADAYGCTQHARPSGDCACYARLEIDFDFVTLAMGSSQRCKSKLCIMMKVNVQLYTVHFSERTGASSR